MMRPYIEKILWPGMRSLERTFSLITNLQVKLGAAGGVSVKLISPQLVTAITFYRNLP